MPLALVNRTIHETTRTNTKLGILREFRVVSWIVLEIQFEFTTSRPEVFPNWDRLEVALSFALYL
jgi:hypothetical protein